MMMASTQILGALSTLLVAAFVVVTASLFLLSVFNRLRLRRVLVTWRSGVIPGFPVWPTAFYAGVLAFLAYAIASDLTLNPYVVTGYLVGGTFWFGASVLSNGVAVTDFSVIEHRSSPSRAVAWGQIVDYFSKPGKLGTKYAFFYIDRDRNRKRLDIMVPHYANGLFQRIVRSKLDARFDYSFEQVCGRTALND